MLVDSAALLLIGLALAGMVRLVLNERSVKRHLAGSRKSTVVKAALIGIPLPLCSCSVVPVTWEMRRAGVSRGGAVSFLVSTPESGVDSIALTWSLMDPVMTVARPVVAFITAISAGLWQTAVDRKEGLDQPETEDLPSSQSACSDGCCVQETTPASDSRPLPKRIWAGLKYGFTDLAGDLALYLLIGYLLAGLVAALWGGPEGGLPGFLTHGWTAYIGALIIGLPLYICATSSTPLAAAMVIAGFPPGAALVLLMVGPATNLASLTVVARMLRPAALVRYLTTIIVVSLVCGLALDQVYSALNVIPAYALEAADQAETAGPVMIAAAVLTAALILGYSLRDLFRRIAR